MRKIILWGLFIIMFLATIISASALDNTQDEYHILTNQQITGSFVADYNGVATTNTNWISFQGEKTKEFKQGEIITYNIEPFKEVGIYRGTIQVGEEILNVKVSVQNIVFHLIKIYELYIIILLAIILVIYLLLQINNLRSRR